MKFKTIFIVFNVIIICSFLFIFFMPLALLGWEYSQVFWERNWVLAAIFIVIIAALNVFFGANWRLFSLLEKEDWPALVAYLEDRIFVKGRLYGQYIKLLVNTYMVSSNVAGIEKLEEYIRGKKPALLERNALLFGVPHVLRNDGADMERYFGTFLDSKRVESRDWVSWNYAFALLLEKKLPEADGRLRSLVADSRDAAVKLLSLYFVDTVSSGLHDMSAPDPLIEGGKASLKKKYTREKFARELENAKAEVHIVILSRLLDDAMNWLYA